MSTAQETVRRDWRIPDELWACIPPLLPPWKPHPLGCHRSRGNDRQAMDAICFVLRTGCQWNALHDTGICSSRSAHRRFQEWTAVGVFLELWKRDLGVYDGLQGIDWEWLAMDRAMTKAPLGNKVGKQPTDRAKISANRSVLTDGGSVPRGLTVEGANRSDFKMVEATLMSIPIARPTPTPAPMQGRCLDTGDDDEVRELLAEFGFTAHIRARGEEAKALTREDGFKARRWVVERTHRWMNRFRRVLIRSDKHGRNYRACLYKACAYMTYKQANLG